MKSTLIAPPALWRSIRDDLLSTPHLERAGVGFAGRRDDASGPKLLLRDWAPVSRDEYLVQLGYHLEVSPVFWARASKRARETGESLIILHSHPRDGSKPKFSPSDDGGEVTLIPKIWARAEVPVGAVVVSPGGHRGRVSYPGKQSNESLELREPGEVDGEIGDSDHRFDRQVYALGTEGQSKLAAMHVGIVGAGGLGSHVVQQLVHLGIGRITVIDPDRVSVTNLSRLVGASRWDARRGRRKTQVARRLAARVGGPTRIESIDLSVLDGEVAGQLLSCDVVFGCTDNQLSRVLLNLVAYQYYVPVVDLGTEIQASGAMGGRVSWLAPGSPCLWCARILDPERVRVEQLPNATLKAELERGYVEGLSEPAPSVVSINGVVASLGVTELLARATGFAGNESRSNLLLYRLSDGVVRRAALEPHAMCAVCSSSGALGAGDLATAPWGGPPPAG